MNFKKKLQKSFAYCPRCGSPFLPKWIHHSRELACTKCNFVFWMNSKPTASCFFIKDGAILLARRAIKPFKGWWDTPGGFLEPHENPELGVKRELQEELGIKVINPAFIGIYLGWYPSIPPQSTFNVYYYATVWKGTLNPADDINAFRWFPLNKLPKKIAFTNNREAIKGLKKIL